MKSGVFDKKAFIQSVRDNLKNLYRKTLEEADQQEIFQAVSFAVKDVINDRWLATQQVFDKEDPKIVYYMSMEFLMGRALGNNLINLKEYKEVREALDEIGLNLDVIEDQEPDPALGNGGLGRLAACFMDSLSTLGYAAYGCGIRYRYGMFKQKIQDGDRIFIFCIISRIIICSVLRSAYVDTFPCFFHAKCDPAVTDLIFRYL